MNFLDIFKKKGEKQTPGKFSDFLLHAPKEKKEEVFKEAARRANEDQRKIFEESRLKVKTS